MEEIKHYIGDRLYKHWEYYIWSACLVCGKERWVKELSLKRNKRFKCRKCAWKKLKTWLKITV